MSARGLMILGFLTAIIGATGVFLGNPGAVVIAFSGGALFGKGYGIWEVRP